MPSGIVFDPGRRKRLLEVFFELSEGLFIGADVNIIDLVIPSFCKDGSSSFTHFVERSHDFVVVGRVLRRIEQEVGLHC